MKAVGRPILASLRGRGYAAQAAAKQAEDKASFTPQELKVSKQPNGIIVASLENYSPISRVSAVFGAGSRYETVANLGITHYLRALSDTSTSKSSGFAIAKNIQQIGGSLNETGIENLSHMVQPSFQPWEVSDITPRLQHDLAVLGEDQYAQMMEALHKAAFRSGLGNSLYIQPFKIGAYSPSQLSAFVNSHLTTDNMVLVGLGVEHRDLIKFSKKFKASNADGPTAAPASYGGGEIRIDAPGPFAHVAVASEGFGWTSKDIMALCVLQQVMGTGPSNKYSSNTASSRVNKAVAAATSNPAAASSLLVSYPDTGLFGFQVIAQAADAEKAVRAAVGVFAEATKGSITDADVSRGKAQLRSAYLMEMEGAQQKVETIAEMALAGEVAMPELDAIDKVTLADVTAVAKKVITGKPSMVAVGDLSATPYLDKL